jgi:crotonobetainyl-CoA:carnitine CoA-transferase CaiB-like acyl-CoA transferase
MSATPPRVEAPPSLDNGAGGTPLSETTKHTPTRAPRLAPLDGVRVVDFTAFQAGPMATLIAADLGAEVIKIESVQRVDGWRGIGRGQVRPWEASGPFHWANRGKRGITLNLGDPRGVGLVRRLIDQADVVVENFTPRVMREHQLDFEHLSAEHPELIMVSMPGYGTTGPWSEYASFAYPAEQLSTISHQTGYAGGPPLFTGTPVGDVAAALMASTAMLAAIRHQRFTGSGQHIDVSQLEAATSFTGEALLAAQLLGDERTRRGNDDPATAPHGMYPCRRGRWVAIVCRDDAEWTRLVACLDNACRDRCAASWAYAEDRLTARQDIDEVVASWTKHYEADDVMHLLQQAGVPAGVVMNGADLLADEHLRSRRFFVEHHGVESGTTHCPAQPFRFAATPMAPPRNAPRLGEHTREVLGTLLGVADDELDELERDQVIGTEPLRTSAI